ncbi:FUSC family protein [Agrobacterium salinitolerans]|uniref:FUSC family protein n=1 Tax=Agrobacterium salinitolerans TaxID=1183413 RepID=UPI0035B34D25
MSVTALQLLGRELASSPERIRGAMEIAGIVTVVVFLAMTFQVPESAISCYLVYYAWRDNSGAMVFEPAKLLLAVTIAIAIAIPLLNVTVDDPILRLLLIALFTFVGMFLSQASKLGSMASTAGFVFAFALTLFDIIPIPEIMSRALLWLWAVMALPMGTMAIWGMLGAVRSSRRLEGIVAAREQAVKDPQGFTASALLDEGMERTDELLTLARLMGEPTGDLPARADDSFFRLALAEAGVTPRASSGFCGPDKRPFFFPKAFRDPRHVRFALKVTLAVAITYGFYTVFGMFEIHTAMITCFYVALASRGEINHKITLRLSGCLLGAALGVTAVELLMPHMTDIGHLLLLVAPVAFVAAWIALGSERISYAGWQLALCFFLVILHGFGPQFDISAATDRIVGILVGSIAMWAVFSAMWPVSAEDDARAALEEFNSRMNQAARPKTGREVAFLRAPLAEAARLLERARFEEKQHEAAGELETARQRYFDLLRGKIHA